MQDWLTLTVVWFVSLVFSTFAVIICIYKYLHHRRHRTSGKMKGSESIGTKTEQVNPNSAELPTTIFEESKLSDKTTNCELNSSNCFQSNYGNDDILILRNLSDPSEEFCINLSDATAPVVKRSSLILSPEFPGETFLSESSAVAVEDAVTLDFEI